MISRCQCLGAGNSRPRTGRATYAAPKCCQTFKPAFSAATSTCTARADRGSCCIVRPPQELLYRRWRRGGGLRRTDPLPQHRGRCRGEPLAAGERV